MGVRAFPSLGSGPLDVNKRVADKPLASQAAAYDNVIFQRLFRLSCPSSQFALGSPHTDPLQQRGMESGVQGSQAAGDTER